VSGKKGASSSTILAKWQSAAKPKQSAKGKESCLRSQENPLESAVICVTGSCPLACFARLLSESVPGVATEFNSSSFLAYFQLKLCSRTAWLTVLNASVNLSRPTRFSAQLNRSVLKLEEVMTPLFRVYDTSLQLDFGRIESVVCFRERSSNARIVEQAAATPAFAGGPPVTDAIRSAAKGSPRNSF
jgi:hypothetical protein